MVIVALAFALLSKGNARRPQPTQAQAGHEITIQKWMDGEFADQGPGDAVKWQPDGKSLLVIRPQGASAEVGIIDAASGAYTAIIPASALHDPKSAAAIRPESCEVSADGTRALLFANSAKVWRLHTRGDYWLWDAARQTLRKVGGDAASSSLMFAKFSPDAAKIGYVYRNNLYVEDAATGRDTPITTDGTETRINGTSDWVYEEELDIRDGWRWSPDGKSIAYWQFDTTPEPLYSLIDDTDTLYPTVKQYPYPLAGQSNPNVRIGVVSAAGGTTVWMDEVATSTNGYIARMDWADNSTELIFEHLNRRQNENRYVIADARSGRVRPVITDTDAAWVDILDTGSGGVRWVNAGRAFLFLSERDGWRHLYAESRDGGAPSLLTPGAFDVDEIKGYDASRGVIYFTASPGNATQRYLYLADEHAATAPRRVTPAADIGTNEYNVSPNGALAIHSVSRLDTPPRHEVVSLPDHAVARLLSDNHELKARLNAGLRGGSKFTQVTAADGETMDASLILPPGFNPARRYPVLFFVYGEPAATVVNDQWDGWNGIFDLIVAERGYIVARVDNRGTPALKGRAWRKSVFHKIGVIASQDQAAAARQLGTLPYVEGNRIAIWGWSGGGSMTLNMMFRYPEIYRVGMSVAPVPDMRLYDTIYQERYMGLPKENEAAYAEGSPITYANRLKGDLLVLHGSGDDNVHYAGTERLVNALVANGKPFQLMVYPNRTHSLDEGAGTSRHVYELLLRFLTTHMPAH